MIVKTECDMGSIKIYNEGMSCFFSNDFGDFTNKVKIIEKETPTTEFENANFLGHFTVKTKPVYLSAYDCADDPIYQFKKKGRYFVYLIKPLHFTITYLDDSAHA